MATDNSSSSFCNSYFSFGSLFCAGVLGFDSARRRWLVFRSCLSEKHVYRGCQSTDEPEASEGESSRIGNSRVNLNSHKFQICRFKCNKVFTQASINYIRQTSNKKRNSQRNSKLTKFVDMAPPRAPYIGQCYARSSNNKYQAVIPARRPCCWVTDLYLGRGDGWMRCQWLDIAYVTRELAAVR